MGTTCDHVFMSKKMTSSPLKARPLPVPGTSSIVSIMQKMLVLFAYGAVCSMSISLAISSWITTITGASPRPWFSSAVAVMMGLITWRVWKNTKDDVDNYKLGRQGELVVAHILEGLRGYGYTPIHDVVCTAESGKEFNIDHVLVGPKGVFVVETKTWRHTTKSKKNTIIWRDKKLYVNEDRYDTKAISQVCGNAQWLHDLLLRRMGRDYWVTPILTFPGWWVEQSATDTLRDKLLVVNPETIGPILGKMENKLSNSEIQTIVQSIGGYLYEEAVRTEHEHQRQYFARTK